MSDLDLYCFQLVRITTKGNLYPQLYHCGPAPALVLRRLGYFLYVRVLLQCLAQGFAEDAHAAAVDHAHPRQSGKEGVVDKLFYGAGGVVGTGAKACAISITIAIRSRPQAQEAARAGTGSTARRFRRLPLRIKPAPSTVNMSSRSE